MVLSPFCLEILGPCTLIELYNSKVEFPGKRFGLSSVHFVPFEATFNYLHVDTSLINQSSNGSASLQLSGL